VCLKELRTDINLRRADLERAFLIDCCEYFLSLLFLVLIIIIIGDVRWIEFNVEQQGGSDYC